MAGGGVLSGGVVFAIAAALWILYLIPTWRRRSEYIATERNAVRMQQTLRILAETSEVPDEIRVEATSRAVAEQQRVLKKHRAEQAAIAKAEAAALALKMKAESRRISAEARAVTLARARRRARLTTTIVLLAALGVTGFGGFQLATTGAFVVLAGGAFASVVCLGMLTRIARVTSRTSRPAAAAPVASAAVLETALVEYEPEVVSENTWTPVPLPRPLHLSQGSAAASAIARADAHERLRAAALAEAMGQRAAELAPPVTPLPERDAPAASTAETVEESPVVDSRFARMGVVDAAEIAANDIVTRRRLAG